MPKSVRANVITAVLVGACVALVLSRNYLIGRYYESDAQKGQLIPLCDACGSPWHRVGDPNCPLNIPR